MKTSRLASRAASRRALSLIELTVVLVVIGLLAGVAIVAFSHYVGSARDTHAQQQLRELSSLARVAAAQDDAGTMTRDLYEQALTHFPDRAALGDQAGGSGWYLLTATESPSSPYEFSLAFDGGDGTTVSDDAGLRAVAVTKSSSGRFFAQMARVGAGAGGEPTQTFEVPPGATARDVLEGARTPDSPLPSQSDGEGDPTDAPTPDPSDDPTPDPTPDPTTDPDPSDDPTTDPEPEPTPDPSDDPTPDPDPEPTPVRTWPWPNSAADIADLCATMTPTLIATGPSGSAFYGTAGPDIIRAGNGDQTIYGLGGDDLICGVNGTDTLIGGAGNDVLFGGNGTDTIGGSDGDDALYGGNGKDLLYGGAGNDVLYGDNSKDTMYGGDGDDALYGGNGKDTFVQDGPNGP